MTSTRPGRAWPGSTTTTSGARTTSSPIGSSPTRSSGRCPRSCRWPGTTGGSWGGWCASNAPAAWTSSSTLARGSRPWATCTRWPGRSTRSPGSYTSTTIPIAVTHSQALLAQDDLVTAIPGDLRDPERVLADALATGLLDLDRPIAVLMISVLHFIPDADRPAEFVARYLAGIGRRECLRAEPRPARRLVGGLPRGPRLPGQSDLAELGLPALADRDRGLRRRPGRGRAGAGGDAVLAPRPARGRPAEPAPGQRLPVPGRGGAQGLSPHRSAERVAVVCGTMRPWSDCGERSCWCSAPC